ncbi:hypothetical protein OIX85_003864 [Vibrio parahaemolyticus]|uniref:hypothetical protein n=1 Tax=Vibrio alginolyticus TaxID=663 RepID=UPI0035C73C64|nr:hypothetical protein [Vibrio parahaemolyticus]
MMNIQLKRFGKDLEAYPPAKSNVDVYQINDLFTDGVFFNAEVEPVTVRVCIYFDIGDEFKESYIKSETDLTDWIIVYKGQRYKVGEARTTTSDLYKSIITPHATHDLNVDLSIGGHK